ncbi:unnamed protein product, partial [Symbiodinium necroappetens]
MAQLERTLAALGGPAAAEQRASAGRLKAEPARPSATQRRSPLDESEDEGDTAAPLAALEEAAPNVGLGSSKLTTLDRALDATGPQREYTRRWVARPYLNAWLARAPKPGASFSHDGSPHVGYRWSASGRPVLHRPRELAFGSGAKSRVRWAELALSKLREEAEFTDRRQKLAQRTSGPSKDQSDPTAET